MGRVGLGLMTCVAALLVAAPTAWAQDSISVAATVTGQTIVVTASGAADSCVPGGCGSQTAEVEATPYAPGSSCGGPGSPQSSTPVATTGGPFSLTTQIPVSGGQQYTVCGYVVNDSGGSSSAKAASAPATVTVGPGPCAAGTPHALLLTAPSVVAEGRSAPVVVRGTASGQSVADVSLTMSTAGDSTPFYTYPFTAADVSAVGAGSGAADFTATLWRANGPATITLSYQEDQSDISTAECVDTRAVTMTPVAGRAPGARFISGYARGAHGAAVALSAPGGCLLTLAQPATITVRGPGTNWTLRTRDECSGSWRVHGQLAGLSASERLGAAGATVVFRATARLTRSYSLVVAIGSRIVGRGVLGMAYARTGPQRVSLVGVP